MFSAAKVTEIRSRIKKAVSELFQKAIDNQKNQNDIILFLINAHFRESVLGKLKKYRIGPDTERLDDNHRIEFLVNYLNIGDESSIKELSEQDEIDTMKRNTVNLELMIYTHIWEAEPNLIDLKQLANLVNGNNYSGKLVFPKWVNIPS